jgi:hypothetical protein
MVIRIASREGSHRNGSGCRTASPVGVKSDSLLATYSVTNEAIVSSKLAD